MEALSPDIAPPELARLAVETWVLRGVPITPPVELRGILARRAGAFVSLRKTDGQLRGCIGTIEPSRMNAAEEIIHAAISAATRDPRFQPVVAAELTELVYAVDVLDPPEAITGPADLDPFIYGVIIECRLSGRRGVLLPRIEGLDTPEHQWLAVHQKAGIQPGTPVTVERFTVTRFGKD